MTKPLPADRVAKTLLGIVPNWTDLFLEHRYGKMERLPGIGGSRVAHPSEFYFLSSDMKDRVDSLGPLREWLCLYVRLNPKIEPMIDARMTPPIVHAAQYRTDIAAFKIIPWTDYGHALITANDYNSIANAWVAFVPLDAIPEIKPDNTPRFSKSDWRQGDLT